MIDRSGFPGKSSHRYLSLRGRHLWFKPKLASQTRSQRYKSDIFPTFGLQRVANIDPCRGRLIPAAPAGQLLHVRRWVSRSPVAPSRLVLLLVTAGAAGAGWCSVPPPAPRGAVVLVVVSPGVCHYSLGWWSYYIYVCIWLGLEGLPQ